MVVLACCDPKLQIYFSSFLFCKRCSQTQKMCLLARGNMKLHTQAMFPFSSSDLRFDPYLLFVCVVKPAGLACITPCPWSQSPCGLCSNLRHRLG